MKKQLTLEQQIQHLKRSIRKFGDPHHEKIPALKKLEDEQNESNKN